MADSPGKNRTRLGATLRSNQGKFRLGYGGGRRKDDGDCHSAHTRGRSPGMSAVLSDAKLFFVLTVLSLPVYVLIWRTFFGGWDDFTEALYYFCSPRWLDWLRGELAEDSWAH